MTPILETLRKDGLSNDDEDNDSNASDEDNDNNGHGDIDDDDELCDDDPAGLASDIVVHVELARTVRECISYLFLFIIFILIQNKGLLQLTLL